MGGAVAAIGGALLFGGLRRVLDEPRVPDALWMGAGLVILANSRPYEGLLLSLPAAAVLLGWLMRQRGPHLRRAFSAVVLPVACLLALGAAWTLTHNRAVTGSAIKLPYQLHLETYPFVKAFVWEKVPPAPHYRHQIMRSFQKRHRWSLMESNPPGIKWRAIKRRFELLRLTFLPGLLWLPLVLLPFALKNRWTLFALGSCLFMLAGQLLTVPPMPYSSAPATALLFLLIVESLRTLKSSRLATNSLAPVAGVMILLLFLLNTVAQARQDNRARWGAIHQTRPRIEADLKSTGGEHVIFVRYGPQHNPHHEWVYNSAAIDSQEVIWSQDRGDVLNRQVIGYYPERQFWLLELGFSKDDAKNARPERYVPSDDPKIGSDQLSEILEWTAQNRDSATRRVLLQSLLSGKTAGAVALSPGVWLAGTHPDRWTRGTRPAVIAVRNDGAVPLTPILRLGCLAPRAEFPITVQVDDGRRVRERVFTARGERSLRLRAIAPGEASLFVLSADKAWRPGTKERRLLGVSVLDVSLEPRD